MSGFLIEMMVMSIIITIMKMIIMQVEIVAKKMVMQ